MELIKKCENCKNYIPQTQGCSVYSPFKILECWAQDYNKWDMSYPINVNIWSDVFKD